MADLDFMKSSIILCTETQISSNENTPLPVIGGL